MQGWDHADPYLHGVTVTQADIDELDHANNIAYIRWCQEAAWRHSAALGLDSTAYRSLDRAMAVQRAGYEYLNAAVAGDSLDVGTWISASDGRMRMSRHFQVRRTRDGETVFRGDWHLVCIRISNGRPVRMPTEFLEIYTPAVVAAR